jgi:hypothetical protein
MKAEHRTHRQHTSILMKIKTVDLMKRLERMEPETSLMTDRGSVFDIVEESFQSLDHVDRELDIFYELRRRNLFIREGSQE